MFLTRRHSRHVLTLLASATLINASSLLFTGGTIIGFNEAAGDIDVIRDGSLLVTDDRIAGIWPAGQSADVPGGTEMINATGKILTPGFIDTHRHGWQTLFKTLMSNSTLLTYSQRFGEFASAGRISAEHVYNSQLAGLYEALNAGVTTSLDHAHHTWSDDTSAAGLNASIDSGARVVWSYAFRNVTNYTVSQQLVNFRSIAEAGRFENTPVSLGIACDFFGTEGSEAQANQVFDLAREFNVSAITAHIVGGQYGFLSGPTALHKYGMLNTSIPVVFSHASYLSYEEAALLRSTNQFVSVTVESEIHMALDNLHTPFYLDQAAIGVDSHSIISTDLVTQARMLLQATRRKVFEKMLSLWQIPSTNPMSVVQAFLLATRNGALALRRPDLGVLAVGAKADVVVWDGTSPGLLGWVDPVAAVILHSSVADVEHVLVDGKFAKRDFKLTAEDYAQVKARFLQTAKWAQDTWRDIPEPEIPEFFNGAPVQEPAQVDVVRGNGTGYGRLYV